MGHPLSAPRSAVMLSVVAVLIMAAAGSVNAQRAPAAFVISPSPYDFGEITVGARSESVFRITTPAGRGPAGPVSFSVAGPDAADYSIGTDSTVNGQVLRGYVSTVQAPGTCAVGDFVCEAFVYFAPKTFGVKTATLVVSSPVGTVSVALRGTGIFGCRPNIVNCNYSDFYSGTISWVTTLVVKPGQVSGTESLLNEAVTMDVIRGIGVCSGTYEGESTTWLDGRRIATSNKIADFRGFGLVTVEFGRASGQSYYQIKASCPRLEGAEEHDDFITPEHSFTGPLGGAPAALEGNEMDTDRQPGSPESQTLTSATVKGADARTGAITQEHPDADPYNNVTGRIELKWSLTLVVPK